MRWFKYAARLDGGDQGLHTGKIRSVITTSQRLSRSGKPIFVPEQMLPNGRDD